MIWLRSSLFFVCYCLTAILFSCLSVLLWPLPFSWRYRAISRWAVWNIWLLRWVCGVRLEVTGAEHIPEQACVILCKHQSAWETLALQAVFPPQVWVLKRELLWIPFFGWGLASLKPIAIDRKAGRQALSQIIEQGKQRLKQGIWVVVFPEGTRIPVRQQGRFGIGGARLSVEAGVPVVPVAHNAGYCWPKRGFLKHPGVIKMVIGASIETKDQSAAEINHQAEMWMTATMTELEGLPPAVTLKRDKKD
ncbi:1-acyl-sn-glycerol-3-phosphate acyltransferase [Methylophaga frappieri]|uniref:1-acyl-sn-glycerol-3-phosphate acyltransferase n=1 Tax=Methylophaga frappieri (strain ATCC BAA-2434 / DSM 25690 / JAM7) TaxID=754477 RepID=I1YK87_METFJ|nr:lysophospholipid acyltransferase family protein [Methylophaga frappieri]AFJ03330.1 1-acyl-sn-glycerol-3-phosphate acyltransferase [Methylophaga frappieri]